MADYPFRINIVDKEGGKRSYFTASFATDADIAVSSSVMVGRILGMKSSSFLREASGSNDGGLDLGHGSHRFGNYDVDDTTDRANYHLSASYTHPNTGSIIFHDRETIASGSGLDFYEFYGSKVCSVLGLPEGIKIRTENFKFSDNTSDSGNYMSGDLISDSVQLKESFKMAPQARMKSNLVWDDIFGEGFIQWVSGSTRKAFMGYNDQKDLYSLSVNQITGSAIKGNLTGNVTGNVTGNASFATSLNGGGVTLGEGFVIQSKLGNETGAGHKLILSASLNQLDNGGDIILQGGHNAGGATSTTNVRGGHIVVRPGRTNLSVGGAFTEAGGSGTRTSGSFIVSGSSTFTGNITANGNIVGDGSTAISSMASLGIGSVTATGTIQAEQLTSTDDASIDQELDVADGYLKLGYDAFSTSGNYFGIKSSLMTGVNDYMMISGKFDYNTYLSAKDGSSLLLRGGGNNSANQIQIYDGDTIDIKAATTYISGSLGVGIDPGTTKGLIRATNDVVAFYSSDKRLKDNLVKLGNPLDKVSQLNGYEFDWIPKEGIHENEGHDVGVIAQEVEKILPEIVQTRDNGYKAVKYEKIVPLLIESIKELTQRVEELENGSS